MLINKRNQCYSNILILIYSLMSFDVRILYFKSSVPFGRLPVINLVSFGSTIGV